MPSKNMLIVDFLEGRKGNMEPTGQDWKNMPNVNSKVSSPARETCSSLSPSVWLGNSQEGPVRRHKIEGREIL